MRALSFLRFALGGADLALTMTVAEHARPSSYSAHEAMGIFAASTSNCT